MLLISNIIEHCSFVDVVSACPDPVSVFLALYLGFSVVELFSVFR